MKKAMLWRGVLFVGLLPFFAPILLGLYHMSIERWTLGDWLVLYSFLYWPTYLVGLALILFAVIQLKKAK